MKKEKVAKQNLLNLINLLFVRKKNRMGNVCQLGVRLHVPAHQHGVRRGLQHPSLPEEAVAEEGQAAQALRGQRRQVSIALPLGQL